jgi:hypothetical protein
MKNKKIISRIKGGLGNQLFCYAAARRLSLVNNAKLVIDDITGFARDRLYHRSYMLDHFNISARKATPAERLEPFERYRRGVLKWLSSKKPFAQRGYLEQEGPEFDERLLELKVNGSLYLDGLWQSERYFLDVEQTIRDDLRITPPMDALNQSMANEICKREAVALHVRWFHGADSAASHNVRVDYYQRAMDLIEKQIESPHYFLFSDDLKAASTKLQLPKGRVTPVSHNQGDKNAYADLWLMSLCRHFITANSTFSWWGAWLGQANRKIVVCPRSSATIAQWDFQGQIPEDWQKI